MPVGVNLLLILLQFIVLTFFHHLGDELYLPRDTWYYFQSSIPLNYIGIEFDLFGTGVNEELPYLEVKSIYEFAIKINL